MTNATLAPPPAHVPPHLVHDWDPTAAPGADLDPHLANQYMLDGPDIVYSRLSGGLGEPGAWLVIRNELIREIYQDAETFSSDHIAGFSKLIGESWPLIPLEKDPPDHAQYRLIVNPLFAPKRIQAISDSIRENAITLIEGLKQEERFDFVPRFAQHFPISVVMSLIGLDLKHLPIWVEWGQMLLHGKTIEVRANAAAAIKDFLMEEIRARREAPREDVMSKVVNAEVSGRPITEIEALGMMYLMFVAGLDTVASTLSFMFRHLSTHPDLQDRLRANPAKVVDALEEIMRAHGIVNSPRYLTKDIEFHGVEMKRGDRLLLCNTIACRDPRFCERPNEIDIDREDFPHMIFSAGPHRCMGSHLARLEMAIALEEWIKKAPKFKPDPGKRAVAQTGSVWGMNSLPLVWDR